MSTDLMGDSCIIVKRYFLKELLDLTRYNSFLITNEKFVPRNVLEFRIKEGIKFVHHNEDDIFIEGSFELENIPLIKEFLELGGEEVCISLRNASVLFQMEPSEDEMSFYEIEVPCKSEWKDR